MPAEHDDGTTAPERAHDGASGGARTAVLLLFGPEALSARGFPRLVPLAGGLTVGRASLKTVGTYLGLPDNLLSRTHLRIVPQRGGLDVEDCGSLNGTYVDGSRLTAPRRLAEGAMLSFGHHAAVFRCLTPDEKRAIEDELGDPLGPVATVSPRLALKLDKLRRLARTGAELLLVGEAGVGKEVYARAVHRASGRRGPFVAINCGALPAERLESELFGGEQPGLIASADGGTLLLDEIAELPARLQGKLFRFLQEGKTLPLGATGTRRVDIRVVAATSGFGGDPAAAGTLRPELLAQLGADPIVIAPLRERPEDIGPLLAWFAGGAVREVEPAALRALCLYGWPLNVRELESCVLRAVALTSDGVLRVEQLPAAVRETLIRGAPIAARRRSPRAAPERGELERLLLQHRGNVAHVARSLDRRWNVVWRWLVRHQLQPERFRHQERPRTLVK